MHFTVLRVMGIDSWCQKKHIIDTLHDIFTQDLKNKNLSTARSTVQLCAATARSTHVQFLGIPYQVFYSPI